MVVVFGYCHCFSILFPFAKLIILTEVLPLARRTITPAKIRLLHLAEVMGKWSMIDVLIVCFVLALTNDQLFISAEPKIGIFTFMTAVLLSLSCSTTLVQQFRSGIFSRKRKRNHNGGNEIPTEPRRLMPGAILLLHRQFSLRRLCAAYAIDDWLWLIINFQWCYYCTPSQCRGRVVAGVLAVMLLVLPTVDLLAMVAVGIWFCALGHRLLAILLSWSILDVFLGRCCCFCLRLMN